MSRHLVIQAMEAATQETELFIDQLISEYGLIITHECIFNAMVSEPLSAPELGTRLTELVEAEMAKMPWVIN